MLKSLLRKNQELIFLILIIIGAFILLNVRVNKINNSSSYNQVLSYYTGE